MKFDLFGIRDYSRKNLSLICLIGIAVLLLYGPLAFTTNIGIDTEQYVLGLYGKEWVLGGLGRFGCYYSIMISNLKFFSPYFNGLVFLLTYSLAIFLWLRLFSFLYTYNGGDEKKINYAIFIIAFLTNPLWLTQFYFTLQIAAMSIAFLLQALAFLLLFDCLLSDRTKWVRICEIIVSVLFSFYAIGTYQSFSGLHIVEAGACLLLYLDKVSADKDMDEKTKLSNYWRTVLIVVAWFLVSFGLYVIVCKIMNWGTSNYLTIAWGKQPTGEIIHALLSDYKRILFGQGEYVGWIMLISVLFIFGLWVKIMLSDKSVPTKLTYSLLFFGNIIAGIILNIVIGGIPEQRARMPLFFSVAFLGMYVIERSIRCFAGKKQLVITSSLIVFIAFSIVLQTQRFEIFNYTMDICNMQQYQTATDIGHHIDAVTDDPNATVAVIGKWDAPLNPSCIHDGVIGQSSFDWGYDQFVPTSATIRSILYVNAALGTSYQCDLNENQQQVAYTASQQMPCFPAEGYVKNVDGLIVVKLSEQ